MNNLTHPITIVSIHWHKTPNNLTKMEKIHSYILIIYVPYVTPSFTIGIYALTWIIPTSPSKIRPDKVPMLQSRLSPTQHH